MPSLNSCHFIGNLTRDPETTQTPTGKLKADLTLAINDRINNTERTTYLYFTAWDKTAEFCQRYLTRGRLVHIEARATQDMWTDKAGKTQRKTYFLINRIQPLDFRDQQQQDQNQQPPPTYQNQQPHYQAKANGYQPQESTDDIPF